MDIVTIVMDLLPVKCVFAKPFMGTDMREYGPYEEEDISKLPIEIADVLISKERAEEIREN